MHRISRFMREVQEDLSDLSTSASSSRSSTPSGHNRLASRNRLRPKSPTSAPSEEAIREVPIPFLEAAVHPTQTQQYPCKPLDSSRRQIRLLNLLNASYSDEIICNLITVSLDAYRRPPDANGAIETSKYLRVPEVLVTDGQMPPYEAVSYTWGATTFKQTLTLNWDWSHYSFSITDNLANALRRLRYADRTRIL